jgi:hypothetical protein
MNISAPNYTAKSTARKQVMTLTYNRKKIMVKESPVWKTQADEALGVVGIPWCVFEGGTDWVEDRWKEGEYEVIPVVVIIDYQEIKQEWSAEDPELRWKLASGFNLGIQNFVRRKGKRKPLWKKQSQDATS